MKTQRLSKLLKRISALGFRPLRFLDNSSEANGVEQMLQLCQALLELKGESTSVSLCTEILAAYADCEARERLTFFEQLLTRFDADRDAVNSAINAWQANQDHRSLQQLAQATDTPRRELLRLLNVAPGGTAALIQMRTDLLALLQAHPELKVLDRDFLYLFQAWFNRGFLRLRRIDWQTPAMVLEKLIKYESVHEIQGWPDLRRRLASDRRCFGFFHPAIPDTPLIFVEVALTREVSTTIASVLDQEPPAEETNAPFDTAVFYSINNCLDGLRGVSFGSFLIKQVVQALAQSCPEITTYITLSPIPGFLRWLSEQQEAPPELQPPLNEEEKVLLADYLKRVAGNQDATPRAEGLKDLLLRLCAYYLLKVKSRGKPADPVARFHLGNGARLEHLNWLADISSNGLRQSAGMMVNYLYDPATMADNHEAYESKDTLVFSQELKKLLG